MPALEELLRRFRPIVAPPGRAGATAIPVDRGAELIDELREVLAAVDPIEAEVARIESTARTAVDDLLESGRTQAARSTALAIDRAPGERAAAYAARRRAGEIAMRRELEAAEQEARRILAVARERIPELTEVVLGRILESPQA
jgi:hypothetical protein